MKEIERILELDQIKDQLSSYCACSLGKKMVEEMKIFDDYEDLTRELAMVNEAIRLVYGYGRLPLGGLHDIEPSIKKAERDGMLYPEELLAIADTINACIQVKNYSQNQELDVPYFMEMTNGIVEMKGLMNEINRCINRDGSIPDNASSELSRIRRNITRQSASIRSKMNSLLASEREYLSEPIITTRNDRYVLPVSISYKNQVKGIIHAQSSSNRSAYIEPESVVLMNNALQDERMKEQHEIEKILYNLSQKVKNEKLHLTINLEIMGTLDFLFAKGTYGKEHDCVVAAITPKFNHLELKQARHPLIDPGQVVSNDICVEEPYHMLLITGSNTGGKTVALKTVGLLSLMSLCGMAIPCTKAVIPFFDQIYCDLGDGQSIAESLSTFSSHMKQIVNITENVTAQSLVLIDEVGSGTDPREGECLAQAVLEYLHDYHCITVASTHYSGLKKYAKDCEYIQFASVEFDLETMAPTYHLLNGVIGHSYAFEISSKLGLNSHIVMRASDIKDNNQSQEDQLLEKLEDEMENNRQLEEKLNLQIEAMRIETRKLQQERNRLQQQREKFMEEAKKEADAYIEERKQEADIIFNDIKTRDSQVKMHEVIQARHDLDQLKSVKEESVQIDNSNREFKIGDRVRVISVNREAQIVEISKNKQEVTVSMGGLKMHLDKNDIEYLGKQKKPVVKAKQKSVTKVTTGHYECNVIGMRYVEAMETVDKFLDDALVNHYPSVRIVHGMGTGALRNGIRKMLDKNKHVASYRDGGPNEGGLGATLVYFE